MIQLAPGVGNIVWFEQGKLAVSADRVAKSHWETKYAAFAARSEDHIRTVMLSNMFKWRIYRSPIYRNGNQYWACRADGHTISFYDRPSYVLYDIRGREGEDLAEDQKHIIFEI